MNNIVIRNVRVLQGIAKDLAEEAGLDPNDLVILSVSLEKIVGSPVEYLLKQIESSAPTTKKTLPLKGVLPKRSKLKTQSSEQVKKAIK